MRTFEIAFILHPEVDSEEVADLLEKHFSLLYPAGGSTGGIIEVDDWGTRVMAYPIEEQTSGHYIIVQFSADSSLLPEFEQAVKNDGRVLRYLVTIPNTAAGTLSILVEPGTASPAEIGEFLAAISELYVMVGGSGIEFRVEGVRIPEYAL